MAGNPEERQQSGKAAAQAARRAEINALAKSTYRAYRESGDNSVFDALLDALLPQTLPTLRMSYGIRDPDQQDDVFQEIALHFLNYAHRYDEERPFLPWWYKIVRNVTMDFLRNSAKQLRYEVSGADESVMDASVAGRQRATQSEKAILEDALGKLSEEDRHILYLYFAEGFTAPELSEALNQPVETVKYHIWRVRKRLSRFLESGSATPRSPKHRKHREACRPGTLSEELQRQKRILSERLEYLNLEEDDPNAAE